MISIFSGTPSLSYFTDTDSEVNRFRVGNLPGSTDSSNPTNSTESSNPGATRSSSPSKLSLKESSGTSEPSGKLELKNLDLSLNLETTEEEKSEIPEEDLEPEPEVLEGKSSNPEPSEEEPKDNSLLNNNVQRKDKNDE